MKGPKASLTAADGESDPGKSAGDERSSIEGPTGKWAVRSFPEMTSTQSSVLRLNTGGMAARLSHLCFFCPAFVEPRKPEGLTRRPPNEYASPHSATAQTRSERRLATTPQETKRQRDAVPAWRFSVPGSRAPMTGGKPSSFGQIRGSRRSKEREVVCPRLDGGRGDVKTRVTQLIETRISEQTLPRHGLLSGLVITWGSALLFPLAAWVGLNTLRLFGTGNSAPLVQAFTVSVILMAAHKLESYFQREFDVCPVYASMRATVAKEGPARGLFISFCGAFVAMLGVTAVMALASPWTMVIFAVWIAHGLHELHHLGKSLARRSYYPGTVTGLLFTAWQGAVFLPAWLAETPLNFQLSQYVTWGYFALCPALLMAFYLEDKKWLSNLGWQRGALNAAAETPNLNLP